MTKKIFCGALCLLAVLAMGLSNASAAEKINTNPKQPLPWPDTKATAWSAESGALRVHNIFGSNTGGGRYPYYFRRPDNRREPSATGDSPYRASTVTQQPGMATARGRASRRRRARLQTAQPWHPARGSFSRRVPAQGG